jgi:hypothetical protein
MELSWSRCERKTMNRRAAILLFVSLFAATAVAALSPVNKSLLGGVAIEGYDAVAYFREERPVEGSRDHTFEWNGATWRFASAGNRDLFAGDPERYAPRYGGYCAWAVSQGYTAGIDPDAWTIHDGKLYLNYSLEVQERWRRDTARNVAKGDANWPKLVGEH